MMRFLTCEDCGDPRYKFSYSMDHFEIDNDQGCIWFKVNKSAMVALAAHSECTVMPTEDAESDDEFYEASEDVNTHGAKSPALNRKMHH